MSGFSLSALKNTLDEVRVQVLSKNETEKKVYEALSSKNYGASSTQMNDIAQDTYDYEKYKIITSIIFQSLDAEGKGWKQIFKSLTLIDFIIKNGAERFIEECRDRLYKIRNLQEYNYYEGSVDKGSGVREMSKRIVELLGNNESIRNEREKARVLRSKLTGVESRTSGGYGGSGGGGYGGRDSGRDTYDSYSGGSKYGNSGIGSDYSGSGGRYGGDSYSSGGGSSSSSGGRYGGGAYDSGRPPRYGDDADEAPPRTSGYLDEAEEEEPKRSTTQRKASTSSSSTAAVNSNAGKLKVNIKSASATKTSTKATPAAEPDFFGTGDVDLIGGAVANDDPFATPAAPAAPAQAAFDPFGVSAPAAPAAPAAAVFDPFAAAPAAPVAPVAPVFDPFAAAPAPAPVMQQQQQQFQGMAGLTMPAAAPINVQPVPMMGGYGAPYQQPPLQPQGMGLGQPQGSAMQATQYAPQPTTMSGPGYRPAPAPAASQDADFGDFTGPATASQSAPAATKPAVENKWGELGSLVQLDKIEKNEDLAAKQKAAQQQNERAQYANNSFAGLDGFSKTPQSMSNVTRPLNSYGNAAPSSAPMGSGMGMGGMGMGAPMGGAPMMSAPAPMGGMGMGMGGYPGAAPMGGMGMGAPMGGMGAPMGGMGGAPMGGMGGYPGAPMGGMGGAPMGGMGGYPGAPMGGMGGGPMGGYPGGAYPNNGYGNMPPRF